MKAFFAGVLLVVSTAGDAAAGTFIPLQTNMGVDRGDHSATLIAGGRVVIAGGGQSTTSIRVFDPIRGFVAAGSLGVGRAAHTATALRDGRVLFTGGLIEAGTTSAAAEIYDPTSEESVATDAMGVARRNHTATLLNDGRVLIAGGYTGTAYTATAEIYDPSTGEFTATGAMATARNLHCATLLPDGKVLITGGSAGLNVRNTAELFDPATGTFSAVGTMASPRVEHTATLLPNGRVLVAGGSGFGGAILNTAEIFNPATAAFTSTGTMVVARRGHSASLLPNGKVLLVGHRSAPDPPVTQAELFNPDTGTFASAGNATVGRYAHTATVLAGGEVLIAGNAYGGTDSDGAELYRSEVPSWLSQGLMAVARESHTATLLPDGKVLVAGGSDSNGALSSAEIFDPSIGGFYNVGSMATARSGHSATLLPNGRVLVTGGGTSTSELYDPETESFTATGSLTGTAPRRDHTATLLADGRVLVTGGTYITKLTRAEIYDPNSGTFTQVGSLTATRSKHAAVLLPDGHVLIVGGGSAASTSSDIFDPETETFSAGDEMTHARLAPEATLLSGDRVLVTGGTSSTAEAEIYWGFVRAFLVTTKTMTAPFRTRHEATLLNDGRVLLTGDETSPASAEVFDYLVGFSSLSAMTRGRVGHRATLLLNGDVLLTGGISDGAPTRIAGQFRPGDGFATARRPVLDAMPVVCQPASLDLTGTGFTGGTAGSDGSTQNSPSNLPILRLQRVDSSQVAFADPLTSTATTFQSRPLSGLPFGHYQAAIISNGIPSQERVVDVSTSSAPTLSLYSNRTISRGVTITNPPFTPHDYAGTLVGITVSAPEGFVGQLSVHPTTGEVKIADPLSTGTFIITIVATTTCASAERVFILTIKPLSAPTGVTATATSASAVSIQWNDVPGAEGHEVLRSTDGIAWTPIARLPGTTWDDTGLAADTTYLYRVRGIDGVGDPGPESATDLALTTLFANVPPGSIIRRSQLEQMRTGVNSVRAAAGDPPYAFTDLDLTGRIVKAVHFQQIWDQLDAARVKLGFASSGTITVPVGQTIYADALVTLRMGMQ